MVRGSKILLMLILAGMFLLTGAYAGARKRPHPRVVSWVRWRLRPLRKE